MNCVPLTGPRAGGTDVIAARAATAFTLLVIAMRLAADTDPQWWAVLALVAGDPAMLAAFLVMTATAHAR